MLLHPKGYGIYGYTLHSPREPGILGLGNAPPQRIAFELARRYWNPDPEGRIFPNGRLASEDDVVIEATTEQLNEARRAFQGSDGFRYPVGEEVFVMQDKARLLYEGLPAFGVSSKSIDIVTSSPA
jgi:hypothetical protein